MIKKIALAVILVLLCTFAVLWYTHVLNSRLQNNIAQSIPNPTNTTPTVIASSTTTTSAVVSTSTESHLGMKLYRNDQWGFEFWYPARWEWKENAFGSPTSKFNLTLWKVNGVNTFQDEILNVVTPQMADSAIYAWLAQHATTTPIIVDGKEVIEYRGSFVTAPAVQVEIPLGELRILIGFEPDHEKDLNNILASFRFIK